MPLIPKRVSLLFCRGAEVHPLHFSTDSNAQDLFIFLEFDARPCSKRYNLYSKIQIFRIFPTISLFSLVDLAATSVRMEKNLNASWKVSPDVLSAIEREELGHAGIEY